MRRLIVTLVFLSACGATGYEPCGRVGDSCTIPAGGPAVGDNGYYHGLCVGSTRYNVDCAALCINGSCNFDPGIGFSSNYLDETMVDGRCVCIGEGMVVP